MEIMKFDLNLWPNNRAISQLKKAQSSLVHAKSLAVFMHLMEKKCRKTNPKWDYITTDVSWTEYVYDKDHIELLNKFFSLGMKHEEADIFDYIVGLWRMAKDMERKKFFFTLAWLCEYPEVLEQFWSNKEKK